MPAVLLRTRCGCERVIEVPTACKTIRVPMFPRRHAIRYELKMSDYEEDAKGITTREFKFYGRMTTIHGIPSLEMPIYEEIE